MAREPYQILEVIEPGAVCVGSMTLESPQKGSEIKTPITGDTLVESIKSFYSAQKAREDDELKAIGISGPRMTTDGSVGLLRIGRHSGAESLTIERHRHIKILQERGREPRTLDYATTFWLAAENSKPSHRSTLKPFGWALMNSLAAEQATDFQVAEAEWHEQRLQQISLSPCLEMVTQPAVIAAPLETEVWDNAFL
jgi:CRISPR-associated protein Csm5